MILVTGATGHLGNVLVRELINRGEQVRALILPDEDLSPIKGLPVEVVKGDILKPESLIPAMKDIDLVYHMAALVTIMPGKEELLREINVQGTKNVLAAAKKAGVRRLVYTSSIHALARPPKGEPITENVQFDTNNPAGFYDQTKAEASVAVQEAVREGMDAVIVCPTGVIGPYDYRQSEMGLLMVGWLKQKLCVMIDGIFDFVDVRDVARGHILAAEKGKPGEVYILSGEPISFKKLISIVGEVSGIRNKTLFIPFWFAYIITFFTPLYYKITRTKAQFTRYALETVFSNSDISSDKARRELGFSPRSLVESVADTLRWYADNSHILKTATVLR
ncbi:MAG TPA: SDR family oxidoreductase [Longilinea sp.]|nr:SDR family oxidoreductase [Longilinea sp.]